MDDRAVGLLPLPAGHLFALVVNSIGTFGSQAALVSPLI